jgi:hypothetical protein
MTRSANGWQCWPQRIPIDATGVRAASSASATPVQPERAGRTGRTGSDTAQSTRRPHGADAAHPDEPSPDPHRARQIPSKELRQQAIQVTQVLSVTPDGHGTPVPMNMGQRIWAGRNPAATFTMTRCCSFHRDGSGCWGSVRRPSGVAVRCGLVARRGGCSARFRGSIWRLTPVSANR